MKRKRIIKHRVAALVCSTVIMSGLITPAFSYYVNAEAVEVMNGATTIADVVMSYCASGGVAVMNTDYIDELYNVFGSSYGTIQSFVDSGLLTYSNGTYVDAGLSTSIANTASNMTGFDISTLFAQTAEQNPAGVALTGGASLAGIAGSVATTGVLPIAAGVAISGYCGFQIGNIIANMAGLYGKNISNGIDLKTALDSVPAGASCIFCKGKYTSDQLYYATNGTIICGANGIDYEIFISGSPNTVVSLMMNGAKLRDSTLNSNGRNVTDGPWVPNFETVSPMFTFSDSYISSFLNGNKNLPARKSPDVIGANGNQTGGYNTNDGKYYINSQPQVNPNTESVNPSGLTKDDWLRIAQLVKGNNTNSPDDNQIAFDDIMNDIKINTPTPSPNPNPDPDPNPDPNPNPDPETVPNPDLNPYPENYPSAIPENVPADKPQPQYTEKQTENETDIIEGDPYTTPDLLNKFPFCIPRDILKVFQKMNSGTRQAPHIQWTFNPNSMIDYTFDIDFAVWDSVASLLRLLELLAFIIALGIATRNLILS